MAMAGAVGPSFFAPSSQPFSLSNHESSSLACWPQTHFSSHCHNVGYSSLHESKRHKQKIFALDAAQPFDYESLLKRRLETETKLVIGIVGFGNFGQFLARRFVNQGHTVLAYSRSDYTDFCSKIGVKYFRDADDFCEEHPQVVLVCTSIISLQSVLQSLPVQRLKRNTLFVDVLSVKEFPRKLFLQLLPGEFDILCTHPMFGPESGKESWTGLPFVYERVRIGTGVRAERCANFLNIFEREGCRMVEMSCVEHDRFAASSQFMTHTVGRILGQLNLESTPINTKGYETLLALVENTASDSFDLYYGLFMYNINATEELERLEHAFDSIKRKLFTQLHDILRKQLFDTAERPAMQAFRIPSNQLRLPENKTLPTGNTNSKESSSNGKMNGNGSTCDSKVSSEASANSS